MTPTLAEYRTANAPTEGFIVNYLSDAFDPQPIAHTYTSCNAQHIVDHIKIHKPRTPEEATMVVEMLASKYFENPKSAYQISCGLIQPGDKYKNILWGPEDQIVATRECDSLEAAHDDAIDMAKSATHYIVGSNATIYASARTPEHCWPGNKTGTAKAGFYTPSRIEQINHLEKIPWQGRRPYVWFRVTATQLDTDREARIIAEIMTPTGTRIKSAIEIHLYPREINRLCRPEYLNAFQDTLQWTLRDQHLRTLED